MSDIRHHAEIVFSAASHWANGATNCIAIMESIEAVRAFVCDAREPGLFSTKQTTQETK